eukprot:558823-Rhodomonas_salina.2
MKQDSTGDGVGDRRQSTGQELRVEDFCLGALCYRARALSRPVDLKRQQDELFRAISSEANPKTD